MGPVTGGLLAHVRHSTHAGGRGYSSVSLLSFSGGIWGSSQTLVGTWPLPLCPPVSRTCAVSHEPLTSLCICFAVLPGLHLWCSQLHTQHSSLSLHVLPFSPALPLQSKQGRRLTTLGRAEAARAPCSTGTPTTPPEGNEEIWLDTREHRDRQTARCTDSSLARSPLSDLASATLFPVAKE